jgi:imidazolonepropionase-like amidohydrolase
MQIGSRLNLKKPDNIIVLHDGLLIDGTGNTPRENISLAIEGNTINDIRESKNLKISSGTRVIDLKDKTILPGFINAHVHDGYNEENLRHWARDGVTTVRDLIVFSDQIDPLAFRAKVNGIRNILDWYRLEK